MEGFGVPGRNTHSDHLWEERDAGFRKRIGNEAYIRGYHHVEPHGKDMKRPFLHMFSMTWTWKHAPGAGEISFLGFLGVMRLPPNA